MARQGIRRLAWPVAIWLLLAGCQGDQSAPLGPTQPGSDASPSLAAKTAEVQERGWVALAFFDTFDASGCVTTYVYVAGSEGRSKHGPGAPTPQTSASVSADRYDWCTGREESLVQGSTSDGVLFRVNGTKATLRATIPVQGSPGKTIKVDMAWVGDSTVFSTSTARRTRSRGTGIYERSTTSHFVAAASGTVSMNGVDLADLAAAVSPYAYIDRYRTTASPDTGAVSPVNESDPSSAGSGGPWSREVQGTFAFARFRSLDESGCVESFSTVSGFAEKKRVKAPDDMGYVGIDVFQIDHCTGTSGLEFSIFLGPDWGASFQVNRQHTVARAQASIDDYSNGTIFHVDIDVGWTAGGFVRHQHGAYFERTKNDPNCIRFTELAKESTRGATARGTIRLNGQNVSPEPALAAAIRYVSDFKRGMSCADD